MLQGGNRHSPKRLLLVEGEDLLTHLATTCIYMVRPVAVLPHLPHLLLVAQVQEAVA